MNEIQLQSKRFTGALFVILAGGAMILVLAGVRGSTKQKGRASESEQAVGADEFKNGQTLESVEE